MVYTPFQIEIINITYAHRPKIVNVKRLVRYTKHSIDHQFRSGNAKFSRVYAQLAKSSIGNVLSPGLVLYAVLQNANKYRLLLNAVHDGNNEVVGDIEIRKAD